ncbi:Dyp-type peroxidase [Leucobacter sp. CSA1]|uniref:Dyp-type peroxidase n=1 Tax=Leucobacter chromiisoli TaxID=2796471 RepID=A0A934UVV4_9MICO|nr:Dyp-type peroxidase [Leucobacter chromiisoli]MBK0419613.1 Dyp-type peroxidase [Leucobacter chromiisoli]
MTDTGYGTQMVEGPLTKSAIFLVLNVAATGASGEGGSATPVESVRSVLADLEDLVKTVGFRDPRTAVSCTVGIGDRVWGSLVGPAKPAELHPFREFAGDRHTAIATPGDLLFHIRSDREDLCFELERLLLDALGAAVTVADEVSGFRYFDTRDLLGFVDGTANPIGPDLPESALVGDEDPSFSGGSYAVVQKYLHPLADWQRLTTSEQEAIMGRTKADNVELDDAESGQKSHKTLATIEDEAGEHDIVRDNMPFARPGSGEFGTYFIGYSRHLWVIERMLERMFIGDPPGLHDRLLDFSTAMTGTTFFVPSAELLGSLDDEPADEPARGGDPAPGGDPGVSPTPEPVPAQEPTADPGAAPADASLGIGSLRNPPHSPISVGRQTADRSLAERTGQ